MCKDVSITELHLCSECNYCIEVPGSKPGTFEAGCLHGKGKPNPSGGLCECDYFRG